MKKAYEIILKECKEPQDKQVYDIGAVFIAPWKTIRIAHLARLTYLVIHDEHTNQTIQMEIRGEELTSLLSLLNIAQRNTTFK